MPHRYFTTRVRNGQAWLSPEDGHHFVRVMRGKVGDQLVICDTNAVEYIGTVTAIEEEHVTLSLSEGYPTVAEPGVEVTLYLGYPKQGKLEDEIRHGVELGACRFVPFFSRYCVATPKKEDQKQQRYQKIAQEAAKQCGRGILPQVETALPDFSALCARLEQEQYDLVLFFYEGGGESLARVLGRCPGLKRVALITGAEGGFSAQEVEQIAPLVTRVGLGPRILRCETAPLAALAAVMTLTGNLE